MKERRFKLGERVSTAIGMDKMGEKYLILTYIYLLLIVYTTIESVFVNTLLFKISNGNMSYIIIYRGLGYIVSAFAMNIAAYIAQRKTPILVIRLSCVFYFITYSLLFFGMNHMETLRHILPLFAGIGGAFYWSGHNTLVLDYSTKSNRDLGLGIFGIVSGITTLLVPVITGFVISVMPGDSGYRVMFGVGMVTVIAQGIFSTKLYPVKGNKKKKSELRLALRLIKTKKAFQLMMTFDILRGMRDGVFAFILNMLLFDIITDEKFTGINTFLTGIMAIIGSWVYGKFVLPHLRSKVIHISTTVLLAFCSILFFNMNMLTVMMFTTVNAFFQLFILNCCNNTTYDVSGYNKRTRRCTGETYGLREISLGVGRVLGLVLISVLPPTHFGYVISMMVLTAIQYLVGIMVGKTNKILEEKREEDTGELLVGESS